MTFQHFAVALLVSFITFISLSTNGYSEQIQSSEAQTLLAIQRMLNYPSALTSWNNTTDFCNTKPTSSVIVICYQNSITQLYIFGNVMGTQPPPQPINNFSMQLLVTTLSTLPNLNVLVLSSLGLTGTLPTKVSLLSSLTTLNLNSNFLTNPLPLELSSLSNLRSFSLDDNLFTGELPDWFHSFPSLRSFSIKNNMFNGTLPNSLTHLDSLRVVGLSHNGFDKLPDFSGLTNLQVLDLDHNDFKSGSEFPYYLLSMPSITHFDISGNKLRGRLLEDQKCSGGLEFVDLSFNLLTGSLPKCLAVKNSSRTVLFDWNCLETAGGDEGRTQQHQISYCDDQTSVAVRRIGPHLIMAMVSVPVVVWIVGGIVIA
ncbi:Probable inactive leucine-rich repeat receptor-like protein kinase At3g03770 [Linum perenne]